MGKTYYYKNVLQDRIAKTQILHQESKREYKNILISLFGIKSVDEIKTQILLSLYPIFQNKYAKVVKGIGKAVVNGLFALKGIKEGDLLSEIEKTDWIRFEDFVICFDDLERTSPELKIEEVIGFINDLVENSNAKIIIIANEGKISDESYKKLKEKVIGNTIEFTPDLLTTFKGIINQRFNPNSKYYQFLDANGSSIVHFFEDHGKNIRTMIFALNYFEYIFESITKISLDEDFTQALKDRILRDVLKFTLAVSNEYKLGQLNFNDRKEIDKINNSIVHKAIFGLNQNSDEKYIYSASFQENYFRQREYYFFSAIYNFLTGGGALNHEEMKKDLQDLYHLQGPQMLPQYQTLNDLSYSKCFFLSKRIS